MSDTSRSIAWEAPEHRHIEKTSDWYWALGIVAITAASVSIILNNVLFGMVILLGSSTMVVFAHRHPKHIVFEVSVRGIRVGNTLYPYGTLNSFCLDEESPTGPQLLVKSKHLFMPLIIIPVPEDYVDVIEDILGPKLLEEHIDEPLGHRLLEFFGF